MSPVNAKKVTGFSIATMISAFTVPEIGLVTAFGTWFAIYGALTMDVFILAAFIGLLICGIIIGAVCGGYAGINDRKAGAGVGAVGGLVALGIYLLYAIVTGAISLAIGSVDGTIFALVTAIVAITTVAYGGEMMRSKSSFRTRLPKFNFSKLNGNRPVCEEIGSLEFTP